jgi:hypothetical protein
MPRQTPGSHWKLNSSRLRVSRYWKTETYPNASHTPCPTDDGHELWILVAQVYCFASFSVIMRNTS